MNNTFNKDRLYAENQDLRERIVALEKKLKDADECLTIAYMQGVEDGEEVALRGSDL